MNPNFENENANEPERGRRNTGKDIKEESYANFHGADAGGGSHIPGDREKREFEEEEAAENERKGYVREYIKSLKPFRKFCNVFSRFPFHLKENEAEANYEFSYNPRSTPAIIFNSLQIFVIIVSTIISLNVMSLLMNFPRQTAPGITSKDSSTTRAEELYIFKRNLAPLIIFMSCLFHINVGNWNFYLRRNFVVTYLNFWPEALKSLRFNSAVGVYKTMSWLIGAYCVFLVLLVLLVIVRLAPVTSGFPGLLALLLARFLYPAIHTSYAHFILRIIATIFILYIFIASKTYPMLFIIKCKLLRNSFALWNRRMDIVLNKRDLFFPRDVAENMTDRVSFPDLFRGHVVLLDLLEGNDELFSETIESYLGSQITSLVFEFYYFYRAQGGKEEFGGDRFMDVFIIGLYLIHSMVFLLYVVISANDVNVEAMDGLEIIRRKGFIGKRSNDELYFLLSMYVSYTGHFETGVNAAGYFVYNKTYFVVIFGAIATYVVILFQFSPQLDFTDASLRPLILDEERLLKFVEDTAQLFPSTNVGALLMDAFELISTNDTMNATTIGPLF